MKEKFKQAYMDVAERFAQLSHAQRAKVGAIIVKDDRIISIGYNGMPSGWENVCEEDGKTKQNKLLHLSQFARYSHLSSKKRFSFLHIHPKLDLNAATFACRRKQGLVRFSLQSDIENPARRGFPKLTF